MENTETQAPSVLDRAFTSFLRWDGEKFAWAALLVVALLSRVVGLGDRAMSHDESLHTVYSWQLYDGRGYQHQPMMHGPLKFILNTIMYFLFGVNDWSARIQVALFGVLMIGLVWMMRPWLGKIGAFLAATMFALSPALLYYSRYIRDEVMLCALMVLLAITMFRYLETRSLKWLVWTAVALGLAFLTMEASFIFGGVFGAFLVLALVAQLWASAWPKAGSGDRRTIFRVAVGVALVALAIGLLLVIFKQKTPGLVLLGLGGAATLLTVALVVTTWRMRLRMFAELDLIVLLGMLVLPFLSALVLKAFGWQISQFNNPGIVTLAQVQQGFLVLVALFVLSVVAGWFWLGNRWFVAGGIFWALELIFFTTFLTNGQGVATGLIGSIGYWIEQQEVMRGGQPWYYFLLQVPLYEFLPLLLSIGGMVAWIAGRSRGVLREEQGSAERGVEEQGSRVAAAREAKKAGGKPSPKPPTNKPANQQTNQLANLPALWAYQSTNPPFTVQQLFDAFLVFWVLATWAVFTYVGEKMAWHVVYFATAMALLGGQWLGRVVEKIDWPAGRGRGIFWLMGMVPLFLVTLKALIPTSTRKPFADVTVGGLSNTIQWVLALLVGMTLVYFLYDRIVAVGLRQSLRAVAVSLAALLAIFTFGVAYRFAFITYDYATEPMVYAHGTPDVKLVMSQVEEISRKTTGGMMLKVAYDDDSTWPLEWYLRDYPKKAYFGANPSKDAVDAPVVIAGDKNLAKVRPYLGDRYYEFVYRLVWWPRETYKGLTWQRIRDGIRDPVQRGQFWDVVIHRRYTTPTAAVGPASLLQPLCPQGCGRAGVGLGAPAGGTTAGVEVAKNPYEGGQRAVSALQQIGTTGVAGKAAGQFSFPRGRGGRGRSDLRGGFGQ